MPDFLAARSQMGVSLAFHIVFAVIGIAMPVMMVVAERRWRVTGHEIYLDLAKRWAKGTAILFAVGAVSGTVLSFELGLLWPGFMAFSGSVIGLPFSAEGFAFFLEAIFLGLYLSGWDRLRPFQHWLTGLPVAASGAASSIFVVMANSWMNTPTGFKLVDGRLASVDPLSAAFNPSTPTETIHMLVSAYVVTGFVVAAVYAAGMLRGRGDRFHRRGLLVGMAMAAVAIVLAGITGDNSARFTYGSQPAKFAAMEALYATTRGAPLHIGGIPSDSQGRLLYAIEIPYGLSILAAFDPNAEVRGLDSFPADQRPNTVVVHLSFDTMVGLGIGLGLLAALFWFLVWRSRRVPSNRLVLWCLVAAGPAAVITMEAGWFVTEFGRQPWIVYGIIRTTAAATSAPGLGLVFGVFTAIYIALAFTLVRLLLLLARHNRERSEPKA